ncbi:MAG: hypothetical protein ACXVGH_13455 [Mycobacteriales bacterium]
MSLFEDQPAPGVRSGADWEQHRVHRFPRSGPAQDEVGQPAMVGAVLARGTEVVVALRGITAFSDGLLLHVVVLFADEQRREELDWSLQEFGRSPGRFRFGAAFPDGSRVATGTGDAPALDAPSGEPVLVLQGSTAGPLQWRGDVWLWPLPTAGQLVLGCRWPDRGIAESLVSVETAPLLAAAAACGPVWTT